MEFVAINKLSLLDYPNKVACIIYVSACNFRCPFCHNGLTLLEDHESILPFDEIVAFLRKRQGILDGVVISGGEPTLMPDLIEKIRVIKNLGFEVKLDTNGTNPDMLQDLLDEGLLDYVAMDIKNTQSKYDVTSGAKVNKERILESIEILKTAQIPHEFRTTLIKEYHTELDMIGIGKMLKGAKNLYLQQFQVSDGVINKELNPVDEETAKKFADILRDYVENVELRGY